MNTRTFALILGIIFVVIGIAGFVPGLVTHMEPATAPTAAPGAAVPAPTEEVVTGYGYLLGLFPVNALHNLFHIIWGVLGVVAYRSFSGARTYARATAIVYGLLAVLGLIPGLNTMFGLLPIYGHDVWLHALIAIAAAYFGFARGSEVDTVTTSTASTRRV